MDCYEISLVWVKKIKLPPVSQGAKAMRSSTPSTVWCLLLPVTRPGLPCVKHQVPMCSGRLHGMTTTT